MKTQVKLAMCFAVISGQAIAGSLSPDHPDVLICETTSTSSLPDAKVFLYLSAVGEDGSSLYQSLGSGNLTARYVADGSLLGLSETVCGGQSLNELLSSGNTRSY
ncbi:hypothetical protein [Ruegeria sp. Alg231-54]|uniref:hypothetical protein n=1 Tax=Ruegeria sp. Alg231-54 TaxID=1922221 RepID=UPI000D556BFD|nr:hypothetical protein [Ruegeria sp. Alg231-54]